MFRWNLLCSSLCPLPLIPALDTTEKSLSSLRLPLGYVLGVVTDKSPPKSPLLQAEQSQAACMLR